MSLFFQTLKQCFEQKIQQSNKLRPGKSLSLAVGLPDRVIDCLEKVVDLDQHYLQVNDNRIPIVILVARGSMVPSSPLVSGVYSNDKIALFREMHNYIIVYSEDSAETTIESTFETTVEQISVNPKDFLYKFAQKELDENGDIANLDAIKKGFEYVSKHLGLKKVGQSYKSSMVSLTEAEQWELLMQLSNSDKKLNLEDRIASVFGVPHFDKWYGEVLKNGGSYLSNILEKRLENGDTIEEFFAFLQKPYIEDLGDENLEYSRIIDALQSLQKFIHFNCFTLEDWGNRIFQTYSQVSKEKQLPDWWWTLDIDFWKKSLNPHSTLGDLDLEKPNRDLEYLDKPTLPEPKESKENPEVEEPPPVDKPSPKAQSKKKITSPFPWTWVLKRNGKRSEPDIDAKDWQMFNSIKNLKCEVVQGETYQTISEEILTRENVQFLWQFEVKDDEGSVLKTGPVFGTVLSFDKLNIPDQFRYIDNLQVKIQVNRKVLNPETKMSEKKMFFLDCYSGLLIPSRLNETTVAQELGMSKVCPISFKDDQWIFTDVYHDDLFLLHLSPQVTELWVDTKKQRLFINETTGIRIEQEVPMYPEDELEKIISKTYTVSSQKGQVDTTIKFEFSDQKKGSSDKDSVCSYLEEVFERKYLGNKNKTIKSGDNWLFHFEKKWWFDIQYDRHLEVCQYIKFTDVEVDLKRTIHKNPAKPYLVTDVFKDISKQELINQFLVQRKKVLQVVGRFIKDSGKRVFSETKKFSNILSSEFDMFEEYIKCYQKLFELKDQIEVANGVKIRVVDVIDAFIIDISEEDTGICMILYPPWHPVRLYWLLKIHHGIEEIEQNLESSKYPYIPFLDSLTDKHLHTYVKLNRDDEDIFFFNTRVVDKYWGCLWLKEFVKTTTLLKHQKVIKVLRHLGFSVEQTINSLTQKNIFNIMTEVSEYLPTRGHLSISIGAGEYSTKYLDYVQDWLRLDVPNKNFMFDGHLDILYEGEVSNIRSHPRIHLFQRKEQTKGGTDIFLLGQIPAKGENVNSTDTSAISVTEDGIFHYQPIIFSDEDSAKRRVPLGVKIDTPISPFEQVIAKPGNAFSYTYVGSEQIKKYLEESTMLALSSQVMDLEYLKKEAIIWSIHPIEGTNSQYYILRNQDKKLYKDICDSVRRFSTQKVNLTEEEAKYFVEQYSEWGLNTLNKLFGVNKQVKGEFGLMVVLNLLKRMLTQSSNASNETTFTYVLALDGIQDQISKIAPRKKDKRPDILIISIRLNDDKTNVNIRLTPIEAKYRTSPTEKDKSNALEQCRNLIKRLKEVFAEDKPVFWKEGMRVLLLQWLEHSPMFKDVSLELINAILRAKIKVQVSDDGRVVMVSDKYSSLQFENDENSDKPLVLGIPIIVAEALFKENEIEESMDNQINQVWESSQDWNLVACKPIVDLENIKNSSRKQVHEESDKDILIVLSPFSGPVEITERPIVGKSSDVFTESPEVLKNEGPNTILLDKCQQIYKNLENLFHSNGIFVNPSENYAIEGPSCYIFRFVPPQNAYKEMRHLQNEICIELALEQGLLPRFTIDRGDVVVEIPKNDEDRYFVDATKMWQKFLWPKDALCAPIGEDIYSNIVGVNFSDSNSCHLLIGGMTGQGKSVALDTILWGLVKHYSSDKLNIRIIDPKGNEFILFEDIPHVTHPIGTTADEACACLAEVCEIMDERYKKMMNLSKHYGRKVSDIITYNQLAEKQEQFCWQLIVLDEYQDLTSNRNTKQIIENSLQRLAQKARACGIHVIVATQKPSTEVINSTTRSNFPAQLALRVKNFHDSRIIMDETGAECLTGKGDAYFNAGRGLVRIQCAMHKED